MRAVLPLISGWDDLMGPARAGRSWVRSAQTLLITRLLIVGLIILVAVLQYRLWVGEGSLAEVYGLKREIAAQERELERLGARNQELQAEVKDLQGGREALEERARAELGMIAEGEIFIQVIQSPSAPSEP